MCIDTDTDTLVRKRSRTRQACPNCAGEQGSVFSNIQEPPSYQFIHRTSLIVLWRKNIRGMRQMLNRMNNLQISDDVIGHIKFNEVIRNITEIQFK